MTRQVAPLGVQGVADEGARTISGHLTIRRYRPGAAIGLTATVGTGTKCSVGRQVELASARGIPGRISRVERAMERSSQELDQEFQPKMEELAQRMRQMEKQRQSLRIS